MKHRQDRLSTNGKRRMMALLSVFVAVMAIVHIIQSAPSARLAGLSEDGKTSGNPSGISARKTACTDVQGSLPALASQFECPPNTMFGQRPHGPDDAWWAYTSDQSLDWVTYENFSAVNENISMICWWGLTWLWSDGWSLCQKDVDYIINFFADAAGEPGYLVASRVVHPTPTSTGIFLDSEAGQSPLWYFEAAIHPGVDLSEGWISIEGSEDQSNPGCGFLWMSSAVGDGQCYQSGSLVDHDRALCLVYSSEGEKGDVNNDGSINVLDMLSIANHILGIAPLDVQGLWRADLNGPVGNCDGDGIANVLDMVKIANIILGNDECQGQSCPTVTDIDGNTYQTVLIGDQCWMAENLKVTRYRNGDPIPNIAGTDWGLLSTGAYCDYHNDVNNVATYGRLYNWYAVNDSRHIAPEGWHVPTDTEWKQLEMYLGMSQSQADATVWRGTDEGGKMKEAGTSHWHSPNIGATNESGFTALPAGFRGASDVYYFDLGSYAYFWSSTGSTELHAWYRDLQNNHSEVYRYNFNKREGRSVRCVRD